MDPSLILSSAAGACAAGAAVMLLRRGRCAARQVRLVGCLQAISRHLASTPDPYLALPAVLSDLGQTLGCIRLELHEVHEPPGGGMPLSTLRCAWAAPGQRDRSADPLHRARPWHPERSRWLAEMAVGRAFTAGLEELPLAERSQLDGAAAVTLAPVAGGGRLRAVVLCHDTRKRRDDSALSALRLLADLFAHALERAETTAALATARSEADAGERAKREFLSNISHELRTPLNGVLGMTGLLLDSKLDPHQAEYAQVVRSSAENLHTLLNDLIDLANAEAGQEAERQRADPLRLAEDVVAMLAERAHAKGIEIAVEPAPTLPRRIVCDPTRLRQVLVNMVGNAIKFTARGHVLVRVGWNDEPAVPPGVPIGAQEVATTGTGRRRANGSRLELTVADTGIGIDPGVQARLFGVFTQGDASTTRRFGGTGLGLAICRRQVEVMGGTISCDSDLGRGAVFTVSVPAIEGSSGGSSRSVLLHTRILGARVLVVEALPEMRTAIAAICQRSGMVPEQAAGCAEALARMSAHGAERPRLVLVSAGLPGASDLPGQVAALGGQAVSFLLMAPLARRPPQAEIERLGFSACIVKPPRCARLMEAAARALDDPADDREETATHAKRRFKVLVVEDDAINQRLAQAVLERDGLAVDIVGDGHEALEALARVGYDAVLMDLMMPVMDGFACAREIRRLERLRSLPHLPIIAVSALSEPDTQARCEQAGFDGFLPKPFDARHLRRLLRRLVPERKRA